MDLDADTFADAFVSVSFTDSFESDRFGSDADALGLDSFGLDPDCFGSDASFGSDAFADTFDSDASFESVMDSFPDALGDFLDGPNVIDPKLFDSFFCSAIERFAPDGLGILRGRPNEILDFDFSDSLDLSRVTDVDTTG